MIPPQSELFAPTDVETLPDDMRVASGYAALAAALELSVAEVLPYLPTLDEHAAIVTVGDMAEALDMADRPFVRLTRFDPHIAHPNQLRGFGVSLWQHLGPWMDPTSPGFGTAAAHRHWTAFHRDQTKKPNAMPEVYDLHAFGNIPNRSRWLAHRSWRDVLLQTTHGQGATPIVHLQLIVPPADEHDGA